MDHPLGAALAAGSGRFGTLRVFACSVGWPSSAGIFLFALVTGSIFSVIAAIVLCVLADLAGSVRSRRNEVKYLLWNLAEAARRGIPLETVARAFAHEQRGGLAARSRNLADYMDAAMPLSLALSRSSWRWPPKFAWPPTWAKRPARSAHR